MSEQQIIALVDGVFPNAHGVTVVVVVACVLIVPILLWLSGFRFQVRKDQREDRDSVAAMMGRLVDQQRAELIRLLAEVDALRRQIDLFVEGRWKLQGALDDMREQMIAARLIIHDYERRLGLPETSFPPLPLMAVIPRGQLTAFLDRSEIWRQKLAVLISAVGVSHFGCRATSAFALARSRSMCGTRWEHCPSRSMPGLPAKVGRPARISSP